MIVVIDSSEQNNNKNKKIKNGYIIFTQFILEVICFMLIAVFLGLYLDKLLNTKCLFLIVLVLILGFVPIYNLVKRMNVSGDK